MTESVRPELLISRLTSPNEPWRVEAEMRLVALGAGAVDSLVAAMRHASPSVRLHAVHALARIGDLRGLPSVVQALGETENLGAVAIAAEKALVQWGAPARGLLLEAALSGNEALVPRAIRALGRIGGDGLEVPLRGLLQHRSAPVRTQAAIALAEIAGPGAVEAIAPLLEDSDRFVRCGVAEALVKLESTRGESVLREVFEDPEEQGQHLHYWSEELLDQIDELRRTGRALP